MLAQDLGLQDIAFIRGWVKTDIFDEEIQLSSSPSQLDKKIPDPPFVSTTAALDTAEQRWAENTEGIERLPFDLNNFHFSPRASLAVPSLNTTSDDDDGDNDDYHSFDTEAGSQATAEELQSRTDSQSTVAEAGSNVEPESQTLSTSGRDSAPTESAGGAESAAEQLDQAAVEGQSGEAGVPGELDEEEEEDEDLLSTLFYNDQPSQLCR